MARAIAVSPGYLTTLVRQRTGRTVVDWITERRMGEARRLLADTRLSVGEVAGCYAPARGRGLFRQAHGVSPRGWRNRPAAG